MSDERDNPTSRLLRGGAWGVVCFLVLPVTIVFPLSVTTERYLSLPRGGVSLRHYSNLLTSEAWLTGIWQSLVIAGGSTTIAVVCGTLCAFGCWRLGSRWSELVRGLMLLPIIVPTIVYALGIYRLWIDLKLLDTFTGVILAHAVTGIPYVIITVSTALAGFDSKLELAARNLGASLGETLRWVVLPIIRPGILAGAVFAFIHSWDELVLVLFITSRKVITLPRRIWEGIQENLDPTMAAVASLLIILTIVLLLAQRLVSGNPRTRPESTGEGA